mmetsp:Transcript_46679/g.75173  ORF Transcript_46679/g.75173 Transcript_46679/m.75173 type:complete len:314 (+) Transcript_46679:167-1108(+)
MVQIFSVVAFVLCCSTLTMLSASPSDSDPTDNNLAFNVSDSTMPSSLASSERDTKTRAATATTLTRIACCVLSRSCAKISSSRQLSTRMRHSNSSRQATSSTPSSLNTCRTFLAFSESTDTKSIASAKSSMRIEPSLPLGSLVTHDEHRSSYLLNKCSAQSSSPVPRISENCSDCKCSSGSCCPLLPLGTSAHISSASPALKLRGFAMMAFLNCSILGVLARLFCTSFRSLRHMRLSRCKEARRPARNSWISLSCAIEKSLAKVSQLISQSWRNAPVAADSIGVKRVFDMVCGSEGSSSRECAQQKASESIFS